jgi:hypothetical protein
LLHEPAKAIFALWALALFGSAMGLWISSLNCTIDEFDRLLCWRHCSAGQWWCPCHVGVS